MLPATEFVPLGRWVMIVDDDIETTVFLEMEAAGGLSGLVESEADDQPEPFKGRFTWTPARRALWLHFEFEDDEPESFELIFEGRTKDGFVALDDEQVAYVFMPAT
ncbi:MAG: hypothetical protein K1X39_06970 [Thermoflexales bacterium]|nr:hypothetical protein [Thermoflexales bacterium]